MEETHDVLAMQDYPGVHGVWFPEKVPAPFNMAAAILTNDKMLSWGEKVRTGLPLLPMLIGGRSISTRRMSFPRLG